jgi:hypothetical protein
MGSHRRELVDGLGLSLLALMFGGLFIYGAIAVALDEKFTRAVIYGVLGLGGVFIGLRMALGEVARFRAQGEP